VEQFLHHHKIPTLEDEEGSLQRNNLFLINAQWSLTASLKCFLAGKQDQLLFISKQSRTMFLWSLF